MRADVPLLPTDGHATPGGVDHQRPEHDDLLLHRGDRLSGDDPAVEVAGAGQSPVHLLVAADLSFQFPRSLNRASISPAEVWTETRVNRPGTIDRSGLW